jgi:hypothetical protein
VNARNTPGWILGNHMEDQIRTSLEILFVPTCFRTLEITFQYNRKPLRRQRTTVSGVTRMRPRGLTIHSFSPLACALSDQCRAFGH